MTPQPLTARERRSVAALLLITGCSAVASMAAATALGKQVFDITQRELDLGWLGLAEFAPAALLVLVTGTVADRYRRNRVVAFACLAESGCAALLAWCAYDRVSSTVPIFGVVLLFGVARAFVAPAHRALPADIVAPDRLPWLTARFSGTWQLSMIVGPVLGGTLYVVDPALPYVIMGALQIVAAGAALAISAPRHAATAATATAPARGAVHEAMEGLRFIRHHAVVLGAISLDLFAVLFGGAVALLPAIAEKRLGVGAIGLGWLRAAGGIGAALTTAVLAYRPLQRRVGRTLLTVVAIFGAATIVLGVTHSYTIAFVSMAVLSGADAISVFVRATLVPLVTPHDLRGRVMAVENVFIGASNELGGFESGVAGQLIGLSRAVVFGGAATLVVAITWWRLFPALRDVDRFPTVRHERDAVA